MHQPPVHADAERDIGCRRCADGCAHSPSGDWASSSVAFAISCGSSSASPSTPSGGSLLCWHAVVPIGLSALGKPLDPRTFLQVLPGCARDTTERLTAHTGRAAFTAPRLSSCWHRDGYRICASRALPHIWCRQPACLPLVHGSPMLPGRASLRRVLRRLRRHSARAP